MESIPYSHLEKGTFLIATPDIETGIFFRGVLLLCEHTTSGSFGIIINKNLELYGDISDADEPYPDYIENIVQDCGQDDYDQFLMVHLGVMEAKGGSFEPGKALTESDALSIMYQIVTLADPNILSDYGSNMADILEFYMDYGIVEESGNNEYRESDNLTNRLALVRISRLFDMLFE